MNRVFTNVQSIHLYIVVSGPFRPNFDLHSSWYQSPTALQADETRRHTEKKNALGRRTHLLQNMRDKSNGKKMSTYIHIRDRVVGRHWFFFFLSLFFWLARSNMKLTPCCQSWHMIRENMEINANGSSSMKKRAELEECWEPCMTYLRTIRGEQRGRVKKRRRREEWSHWVSKDGWSICGGIQQCVCLFDGQPGAGSLVLTVFNLQSCSCIWCINKKGHFYLKDVPSC